jgi:hypothetical protein
LRLRVRIALSTGVFGGLDQPCACEVRAFVVREVAEERSVDGYASCLQVVDDSVHMLVDLTGDDGDLVLNANLVRGEAEQLGRADLEFSVWPVLIVYLAHLILVECRRPRRVLESLSDYVARRLLALEFEHVQNALGVECEQVHDSAEVGVDLTTDHEERLAQQ